VDYRVDDGEVILTIDDGKMAASEPVPPFD